MRRAIAGAIFGVGLAVAGAALACPPASFVLSEHLGQSVSLEGTLENCKLDPCLQIGDEVVYLRGADVAGAATPAAVRVRGTLEHDEGSGPAPDGCAARGDCVADVPAHYFIRGATIEPVR
jgi:hypothetical protein